MASKWSVYLTDRNGKFNEPEATFRSMSDALDYAQRLSDLVARVFTDGEDVGVLLEEVEA